MQLQSELLARGRVEALLISRDCKKITVRRNYYRGKVFDLVNKLLGMKLPVIRTKLTAYHIRDGKVIGIREVYDRLVTTAGVNYLVDALQNIVEPENLKFHAAGTGVAAEAAGDTTLGTEVETRASGTTVEGASANIYRTVGTVSFTATRAITEHGVLSASSAGTLLDRSVFTAINVVNGDSIQFTYELTLPSGG